MRVQILISLLMVDIIFGWMWTCDSRNLCQRVESPKAKSSSVSLERCKLTCGKYGALWPKPKNVTLGSNVSYFLPQNVFYTVSAPPSITDLVEEAFQIMINSINMYHPKYKQDAPFWKGPWDKEITNHNILIQIDIESPDDTLKLSTDESYSLNVKLSNSSQTLVTIRSPTFFGARHALETVSQLINFEPSKLSLQMVNSAEITDGPAFKYRGLLLDTSRNYFPVNSIKRTLDGMGYNKLNSFHWHMTDSNSLPIEFPSVPNVTTYGVYDPDKMYSVSDIKEIVEYAKARGIRIVPELDAPAHVGHGWDWGTEAGLGDLLACFKKEPYWKYCHQPPCGHLNLANKNVYVILERLYRDILNTFGPLELFHFGGDEVFNSCWNSSEEIKNWMRSKNRSLEAEDYLEAWGEFQENARQLLTKANKGTELTGILWTSGLNMNDQVEKHLKNQSYVIQIWTGGDHKAIGNLLQKGYKLIFSNYDAWYLDCGFSEFRGGGEYWCPPYKGWQTVYDNSPKKIAVNQTAKNFEDQILGGEATVWSEMVDEHNLDTIMWPRGSALGERLWSDPDHGFAEAEIRNTHHRQRLAQRGLHPRRLQPEWCHQYEGECYAYKTSGDIVYQ